MRGLRDRWPAPFTYPAGEMGNSGCRKQTQWGRTPDPVYNRAGGGAQYVDIKYPRWRADFRRLAAGFALAAKARRMGATDVAQFARYAESERAIRFVGGNLDGYASGSSAEGDRRPSEDSLAICAVYADAVDSLSIMLLGEDYVGTEESAIYDMADSAYDGGAEPTGGEFSIAPGRAVILRCLRAVALDYTRGALRFARGQSSRAFAMCGKFYIVTRNMILSGGILLLYAEYMRPGGSAVCGVFADELDRCARGKTIRRDLPGELKWYPGIAVRGVPFSSRWSIYCTEICDILPPAIMLLIFSIWARRSTALIISCFSCRRPRNFYSSREGGPNGRRRLYNLCGRSVLRRSD